MSEPLLQVDDLSITFATPDGDVVAVRGLDYEVQAGETLGIVGESGSGKSQSVLALMGLPQPTEMTGKNLADIRTG